MLHGFGISRRNKKLYRTSYLNSIYQPPDGDTLQPGIERAKVITKKGRVAVLMDVSESMSLPAYPGKKPRIDAAREYLSGASDLISSIKKDHDFEIYSFSEKSAGIIP
jgi:hypothetical protein